MRLLQDLPETTEYEVRGKEGNSAPWVPERGLMEGCPSSPGLFNIYHQAPMRIAEKKRKEKAEEDGRQAGIVMKWVTGSAFRSAKTWEKKCTEAVAVVVEKSMFADDTTAVGEKEELSVWNRGYETGHGTIRRAQQQRQGGSSRFWGGRKRKCQNAGLEVGMAGRC